MIRYKIITIFFLLFVFTFGSRIMLHMGDWLGRVTVRRLVLFSEKDVQAEPVEISKNEINTENNPLQNTATPPAEHLNIAKRAIHRIETEFSDEFPKKMRFVEIYGAFQRLLDKKTVEDVDKGRAITKESHHFLHFPYSSNRYDKKNSPAKLVIGFNHFLNQLNMPLLYVQVPHRINPQSNDLPYEMVDYENPATDDLRQQLESNGIATLDLREEIFKDNLDWDTLFFRTDHHWRIETAFWAHCKVIEKLNSQFHCGLDSDNYYRDIQNYERIESKNPFLGSQGKRVGRYYAGVDDFSYLLPKFETNLRVKITKRNAEEELNGSFQDTIFKKKFIESTDVAENQYAVYFGGNYPKIEIINSQGKGSILIIQNSHGRPFSAFMTQYFQITVIVDLRHFQGSLRDFISKNSFDVVLIIYDSVTIMGTDPKMMFDRLQE
ncbi:MAG: hypothetical protein LBN39_10990 [Planctomycetaceae bacterium]|jgi:hypothetical protein|nr:hypothetical protein [Planctomycetaceae bacterium]